MKKTIIYILYFFIVFSFLYTCNTFKGGGFYEYNRREDMWRVPLIEPYELTSTTNYSSDDWFFIIKNYNPYKNGREYQLSFIDSVLVLRKENIILLHSHKANYPGGSGQVWLIVSTKNDSTEFYTNRNDFKLSLKNKKINSVKMYPFEELMRDFVDNLKLPPTWK